MINGCLLRVVLGAEIVHGQASFCSVMGHGIIFTFVYRGRSKLWRRNGRGRD